MNQDFKLNSIEEAIEDFKADKLITVVDGEGRENGGDLIVAAEPITPEKVNFMIRRGRRVFCTPIIEGRTAQFELNMQVHENTSLHETPSTMMVDLIGHGCMTGISMCDRAMTIKALAGPNTKPTDLAHPGHVNLPRARDRGMLRRADHTETAIDLARLVGLQPVGALIEIINEDGMMARLPQLVEIAKQWNMKIISIENLIAYRLKTDCIAEGGVRAKLPTEWGMFDIMPFCQRNSGLEHITFIKGDILTNRPTLVCMHSGCATGDTFGSLHCERGEQLRKVMEIIEWKGADVITHLNQEERGVGLMDKIEACKLRDEGLDTVSVNLHLGHKVDERDYGVGAQILRATSVTEVRLMTDNLVKRVGFEVYGLKAVETVPLETKPNQYNVHYLYTKGVRVGYDLHNVK